MTPDPTAADESDQAPPDSDGSTASDGQSGTQQAEPDGGDPTVGRQTGRPEYVEAAEEFDWRGWLLVGLVFVCFLVIPAIILFLPAARGFISSLGLSLRQAYLALPMIPAILLGVTAVWAALRAQRTRRP